MRNLLVSMFGGQTVIAPTRSGPWGLYIYPRRSGAGNERILAIQEDRPEQVLALPTGMVFQNLTARYLRITGVEHTTSNLNGGLKGGLPSAPDQGGPYLSESPQGTYSVLILEDGETMAPVERNLKIPRYSIANTGPIASLAALLQNPNSMFSPQTLAAGAGSFGPYDVSLFDTLMLSGQIVAIVGGSSPNIIPNVFFYDLSGYASYVNFAGTQGGIGAGGIFALNPGITAASIPVLGSQVSQGLGFSQAAVQFLANGAPTSASVLFDFQGR